MKDIAVDRHGLISVAWAPSWGVCPLGRLVRGRRGFFELGLLVGAPAPLGPYGVLSLGGFFFFTGDREKGLKMKRFLTDETGASLVEYALLLSLVTVASIVVLTALGTAVNGMFSNVAHGNPDCNPQNGSVANEKPQAFMGLAVFHRQGAQQCVLVGLPHLQPNGQ